MRKVTYTTGTGDGNIVVATEKPDYLWFEFSSREDCDYFVGKKAGAEFKGVKTKVSKVQNEDLSWSTVVIKTYQVKVAK